MEVLFNIPKVEEQEKKNDALHRVCERFIVNYQPILLRVENYLEEVISKTDKTYKEAYIPWKNALHELLSGVYSVARDIPIPNKEKFTESLCMFSFEGAATFLRDICNICQLRLKNGWRQEFREHIRELHFSIVTPETDYQI